MDATFIVNDNFQFGGGIKRGDSVITVSESFVKAQMELGKHPKTKKWLSGVLNHCEPADDFTAELIGMPKKVKEAGPEEIAEKLAAIKKEMDDMGAAYDRRWKLARFEIELVKAKKERGL
jgi:hypothetical protein